MTYAGDSELSEDIRQRVEETFKQSRELALEGKTQEASLGCEFILRLDSLFEPARELLSRIESGADLTAAEAGGDGVAPDHEPATPDFPGAFEPAPDFDLAEEMDDLLDKRDFRTLLNLAEQYPEAVKADPELQAKVSAAGERLEAEPYVRAFIDNAEAAHREGRGEMAKGLIEKARALDPSHPSLPEPDPSSDYAEGNDRIRELLEEGQRALDRNDHQGAIDSWSRIFLIDIDHAEANKRIERARRLKAENERMVEEAYHEGVSQWELGATDKAREQFERVLSLAPGHTGAKGYIERMDAHGDEPEPPSAGAQPSGDQEIFTPPDSLAFARSRAPQRDQGTPVPTVDSEVPMEFDDEQLEVAPAPEAAPRPSGSLGSRRFRALAGVGVLALLAIFAALYWKRDVFFPNSEEIPAATQVDALARARKLEAAGQTTAAIAQLRRLPIDHPQYAEAQGLIAQWEAPEAPAEPVGPSDEELAERDAFVARAQAAKDAREYLQAAAAYEEAASIAPLDEPDLLIQEEVRQRLAGLESQLELFEQGDWEFVLPDLWRLHAANPDDKDVVRLMVSSYYNLGVRDLQRGDTPAAVEKLTRAQELDPDDAEVERLLRFSRVYGERPADLLYRIFVKYLPFR